MLENSCIEPNDLTQSSFKNQLLLFRIMLGNSTPRNRHSKREDKKNTRKDFDGYYFNKNVIICDDKDQKIAAKVCKTSKYWLMLKTSNGKTIFMNKAFIKSIELAEEEKGGLA
ncbi:hypothetical protein [Acidianus two-tailed virus 2]|nr:hypothetical protein [Acidianus two-tailed virus 2]